MKITAMVTMAAAVGMTAWAGENGQTERRVTVCMEAIQPAVYAARAVASKMFAGIGVMIEWRRDWRSCPAEGILLRFSTNTPEKRLPGALAYALPYEGVHIDVFYDRVQKMVDSTTMPFLVAHVLVHEITHILQGISRHSNTGIMKANWTGGDFGEMTYKPLPFAPVDIELLYRGLHARASRLAAGTQLATGSTPATVSAQ